MNIHTDLTFFTNEPERNLYERFNKILKSNTQFFDALVGYFRTSGFYLLYPAMEDIERVRILVGLNVDQKTVQIIQQAEEEKMSYQMSHKEIRDEFTENINDEMINSEDSYRVDKGIKTFIKWLVSGKLEMRIYPEAPIHAKVYIMRKDMIKVPDQYGSVITGSSNFSKAGLVNNLEAYNGVFISDVVGLGKTFISALLAQRLKGRKLVICPPVLKEYWTRTFEQFEVSATVESLGKLDSILDNEDLMSNVKYVFIDEAHRFRNQKTDSFKKLHQICYNKKVILITATPQNNYSTDIANQIYLFQPKNNSTIMPNNKNIERFFNQLDGQLKKMDKGSVEYSNKLKDNSEAIRDKVLRNVMIRRTRNEIKEYYKEDLDNQGLFFPELGDPDKIIYTYDDEVEKVFNHTIGLIKRLNYSRYKPLTYLKEIPKEISSLMVSQRNMSGFMKSILIKRLESSFEAFKKTLGRFIKSYIRFIEMCETGQVYISKKVDVYDLLDNGDDDKLMELGYVTGTEVLTHTKNIKGE